MTKKSRVTGVFPTVALVLATICAGYSCMSSADDPEASVDLASAAPAPVTEPAPAVASPAVVAKPHVSAAAGGYHARFSEDGATLTRAKDASHFSLRVVASGRRTALTTAKKKIAPREDGARTVFERGAIREWFETTPNGIEHSFAIDKRPAGAGSLVVDVATSDDLVPGLVDGRPNDAVLKRADGTVSVHYGALAARDAAGNKLEASFELVAARLRIRVDDRAAVYPVTVDPLIWAQEAELTELHAEGADLLGGGLAIDGDRIVAGINGRDTHRGGAAFFERKGAKWTETNSWLVPPTDPDHREDGIGAAVEGNTALLATGLPAQVIMRDDAGVWNAGGRLDVPLWNTIGGNNGARVALSGDTAVVSVSLWLPNYGDAAVNPPGTYPGALFFYGRDDAGAWTSTRAMRYAQNPASWTYGNVALQGDTLALNSGWSIIVYHRNAAGAFAFEKQLVPPPPSTGFLNGFALDGDTIIAGCTELDTPYVAFFQRTAGVWGSDAQTFTEPSPQFSWQYGDAATIKGDDAFVGDFVRNATGAIFRYRRTAGVWAFAEEIAPVNGGGRFGTTLAMSTDTVAIGAPGDSYSRGAVWVYANRSKQGDPCKSNDTCSTDLCVDGVCCDTLCGGGSSKDCLACNTPGHVGTCGPAPKASECRPKTNDCDVHETCDGTNITCPADTVLANGTTCSIGHCVAGACSTDPAVPEADASAPPIGAAPATASDDSGCTASPHHDSRSGVFAAVAMLAALGLWRARRRLRATPAKYTHSRRRFAAFLTLAVVTGFAGTADAALVWRQREMLEPATLITGDAFGNGKVLLSGSTLYIGTYGGYTNYGGVYTYERVGNDWIAKEVIVPPDAQKGEGFGKSFGLSGDTLAVSAFRDGGPGSVYVFVKTAGVWALQQKIPSPFTTSTFFGWNVVLSGETLVATSPLANGSQGAVYIYTRTDSVWTLVSTLTGDPDTQHYGSSAAIDGTTLAIGAATFFENVNTTIPGHAYIYTGAADTWTLEAKLSRPTTEQYFSTIFFGTHIAIDGDTAIVTNGHDYTDPPQGGRAYVYTRADGVWTEAQTLKPSDSSYFDAFGSAGDDPGPVLHGDRLLLNANGNNVGRGASYLFERSGGVWTQTQRFVANDSASNQAFGISADFSNDMIIFGAPGAGVQAFSGRVYSFFHGSEGDACTSGAPCATGFCVDGVCCDTACGGGAATDCMACSKKAGAANDGTCGPTTPHVCRAASSDCDAPESCDGANVTCPADLVAPNGRTCSTGTCSGGKCLAVIPLPSHPQTMTPAVTPPEAAPVDMDGGCSCRATRRTTSWTTRVALGAALLFVLAVIVRRRLRNPRQRHAA